MDPSKIKFLRYVENIGNFFAYLFHILFLFLIGVAIIYGAALESFHMLAKGHFSINDILLLFIYLELVAMVGIYFTTHRMPVNFLIYVVITALTRTMIGQLGATHDSAHAAPTVSMLIIPGAILILSLAVVVNKFGRSHLVEQPKPIGDEPEEDKKQDARKHAKHLDPVPGESVFPPAPKK